MEGKQKSTSSNITLSLTPLVTGGVILIVLVVGYLIYKLIKNSDANQYLKKQSKEINKGDLTYSVTDYTNYANRLLAAMKGPGTDEETIFAVFNAMNTESDIRQLVAAFGLQKDETLQQWLLGDLSKSDMQKLNNLLKTKGINYTF